MTTTLTPPRILTVDDDPIVRADLRVILEDAGYSVVPDARDGAEAVERAREHAPDLIVLDLGLPGLDGFGAAATIRRRATCRSSRSRATTRRTCCSGRRTSAPTATC